MPFDHDEFIVGPMPRTVEAYRAYKQKASDFIRARNQRILNSNQHESRMPVYA
jgi:hypothetical protein